MTYEEEFQAAGRNGKEFRGAPFWSWNDDLDPEELRRNKLRRQLEADEEVDRRRWEESQRRGETPAERCKREAEEWRMQLDAWIVKFVGPFRKRRKQKRAAPDPETGVFE